MRLVEFLWSFLPDKCQVETCTRRGVRGNENVVDGIVMCDECLERRLWLRQIKHARLRRMHGKAHGNR